MLIILVEVQFPLKIFLDLFKWTLDSFCGFICHYSSMLPSSFVFGYNFSYEYLKQDITELAEFHSFHIWEWATGSTFIHYNHGFFY